MKITNSTYQLPIEGRHRHDCRDEVTRALPLRLSELIRTEFAALWERRPHLLHLAVTEAAALADRTGFPQLFLPALVLEKAEGAAAWHSRQRNTLLDRAGFPVSYAQSN